jgi:hypothetical protein
VPVIIALSLFLNTPLILTVSALLYIFTASIGGRRGRKINRPDSSLYSNLRNNLYSNFCSSFHNSLYNSLCNSLSSFYNSLYNSLYSSFCNSLYNSFCNSLYNSLYNSLRATTLVIISRANSSNLVGLKLARSAV